MIKVRTTVFALVAMLVVAFSSVKAQEQNIVEIAAGNEDFSTLVSLVQAAGLAETLSGEGPFTVFAPTNDAFAALPDFVVAYLVDPAHVDVLTQVLTYHVIGGAAVMSTDITAEGVAAATVQGQDVMAMVTDAGVMVNNATVVGADIAASNGVIHVIDTVILPDFELPGVDALSVNGTIIVAGSSTVLPVSERIASLFTDAGFAGDLTVEGGGTGSGFERFCTNAETDIADASRTIRDAEIEACVASGRPAFGFNIGIDALVVAVSTENTFVESLNIESLALIFSGAAATWDQVNPEWPAEPIQLFSPGSDSGTFDFFVDEVLDENSEALLNAPGIQLSEDDNVLVTGVESSPNAIGYFGGAYYFANTDRLRAVNIEGIEPNFETAESGEYPLARPLYIYTSPAVVAEKPEVGAFINFYLTNVNAQLGVEEGQIGYFPASDYAMRVNKVALIAMMAMGMMGGM
jgi:phosphate binding protein